VLSALSGALWGAGIGALVGRERWDSFDLAPRTVLHTSAGAAMIGIRLAF
jgi:hypothetical protein